MARTKNSSPKKHHGLKKICTYVKKYHLLKRIGTKHKQEKSDFPTMLNILRSTTYFSSFSSFYLSLAPSQKALLKNRFSFPVESFLLWERNMDASQTHNDDFMDSHEIIETQFTDEIDDILDEFDNEYEENQPQQQPQRQDKNQNNLFSFPFVSQEERKQRIASPIMPLELSLLLPEECENKIISKQISL